MRFTNEAEIAQLIDNPRSAKTLQEAKKYSKKLRLHIHGESLSDAILTIEGFEDGALHKIRAKYAKSNKALMARLAKPLDKVFTARGGSPVYYKLNETQDKKAAELCANIRGGYTVKDYVKNFWKIHYLDDPNGIILTELPDAAEAARRRNAGLPAAYPVYISSASIHDYELDGRKVEYLICQLTEQEIRGLGLDPKETFYRVYDDAFDYTVKWDGNAKRATIQTAQSFPNYFGFVPAITCGAIPHDSEDNRFVSFFDPVVELADEFFLTGSIRLTHNILHGFPKYWEYADNCRACNGTGYQGADKCKVCKGVGKAPMVKVSDVKILTAPTSKEDPLIAPNVAGYVQPSKDFHEMSKADLADLEAIAHFTLYGATPDLKTSGMAADSTGLAKTATEVVGDMQPKADTLYVVSEAAEETDRFIRRCVVIAELGVRNYAGPSYSYGRRYLLEGPDTLFEKYSKAKKDKAPVSTLDDLYEEYIESKYDSDPLKQMVLKKLMKVEPFFHLTSSEVLALMPDENDLKAKLYFGEWLSTLTDAAKYGRTEQQLRADLLKYAGAKKLMKPEPAAPVTK